MTRMIMIALLLGILLCGCGRVTGADTPEAVYEKLRNAFIANDSNAAVDCLPPSLIRQMEKQFDEQKKEFAKNEAALKRAADSLGIKPEEFMRMSYREICAKRMKVSFTDKDIKEMKESKIIGKELDGDICRLKIQSGNEVATWKMVREDNRWYWSEKGETIKGGEPATFIGDVTAWLNQHFVISGLPRSATAELIQPEGPAALVIITGTGLHLKGMPGGKSSEDRERIFFQEFINNKLADPNEVDTDNLAYLIRKHSGINENSFDMSKSNLILVPDGETKWPVIESVIMSCARNKLWKISALTQPEKGQPAILPIYLPKDKGLVNRDSQKEIQIRIREGKDWKSAKKELGQNLAAAKEKKFDVPVQVILEVDKKAPFRKVVDVLDMVRDAGFKDDIRFSVYLPSANSSDFQIRDGLSGIDTDPVWKDIEEPDHTESPEDFAPSKGDDYDFVSDKPLQGQDVYGKLGVGGGSGGRYGGPRGGRRNLVTRGGGKMAESSVLSGLYWLARHQNKDGSWGVKSFQNQCRKNQCEGVGYGDFDVGVTGLALLAFTGANYTPSSREIVGGIKFGDVVRKAASYLVKTQNVDGSFGPASQSKFMYNHAIATYAMCDLVMVMKDKDEPAVQLFEACAKKAAQYLVDARNPGKAWRYTSKCGDNDASVTAWCMMALKTAEAAALLKIPQNVWDGVRSHLDDVTDSETGLVGYQNKGSIAILASEKDRFDKGEMYLPQSLTAAGIMCRILMGEKRDSGLLKLGADCLTSADNLPKWDASKYGRIDYYYWFYGSYALHQFDGPKGPVWKKWETAMVPVLVKNQKISKDGCANGSWEPCDRWSDEAGRVYSTALAILTLESYYRLRIEPVK